VFTRETYIDSLELNNINYEVLKMFEHFHTTRLNGTFLNHKTRNKAVRTQYLLKLKP
jgi:hypothetical protein